MENIRNLRKKIDKIDERIIFSLKERMDIARKIGVIKMNNGLRIKDHQREDEIYLHVMAKALEVGLDPQKIESIFKEIVALGISVQGAE